MNSISVQINSTPTSMSNIIESLASKREPTEIYCWYEGTRGLPKSGATFYKESFLEPLLQQRQDVSINLYSLKGWDFSKTAFNKPDTPLGQEINRCQRAAIRCFYSSSFFQFCKQLPKENNLCRWADENLRQKQWLSDLSIGYTLQGKTVSDLFDNQSSLLACLQDLDVVQAYSYLQYMEGYYLIREAIIRAKMEGRNQVQVAFVLPNNEGQYYQDLPQDLESMLRADLDLDVDTMAIDVSFLFFSYGDNLSDRPYIDRSKNARNVAPKEIAFYLPLEQSAVNDEKLKEACS